MRFLVVFVSAILVVMRSELERSICLKIQEICKQKLKYRHSIDVEALVAVTVDNDSVVTLNINSFRSARVNDGPPGESSPRDTEQQTRGNTASNSTDNDRTQASEEESSLFRKKLIVSSAENGGSRSSARSGEFRHPSEAEFDCSNTATVQVKAEPIDNDNDDDQLVSAAS